MCAFTWYHAYVLRSSVSQIHLFISNLSGVHIAFGVGRVRFLKTISKLNYNYICFFDPKEKVYLRKLTTFRVTKPMHRPGFTHWIWHAEFWQKVCTPLKPKKYMYRMKEDRFCFFERNVYQTSQEKQSTWMAGMSETWWRPHFCFKTVLMVRAN